VPGERPDFAGRRQSAAAEEIDNPPGMAEAVGDEIRHGRQQLLNLLPGRFIENQMLDRSIVRLGVLMDFLPGNIARHAIVASPVRWLMLSKQLCDSFRIIRRELPLKISRTLKLLNLPVTFLGRCRPTRLQTHEFSVSTPREFVAQGVIFGKQIRDQPAKTSRYQVLNQANHFKTESG
jgi:hypothetical protein